MTVGAGGSSGFAYYDADLNLVNNDQFGTCTLDSLDPLTITYTINEGVTWSDGTPVDAADLIIEWAAQSGVFNDADTVVTDTGVTAQADPEGSAIVVGADGADIVSTDEAYAAAFDEDGALLEGYTYKASTGVSFDTASESLQLITQFPEISEDGQSVTATWDTFYVDYADGRAPHGRPGARRRPASARHRGSDGGQGGADRRPPDGASRIPPTSPTSRPSPRRTTRTSTPRRCRTTRACTPATARTTWSTSPRTGR